MTYNPSEALERIDNDRALLAMLIGVFLKEAPGYCARLQEASDAQNIALLGDVAHNIKGASSAIGFDSARTLAAQLETLCRQTDNAAPVNYQRLSETLIEELKASETPMMAWVTQHC